MDCPRSPTINPKKCVPSPVSSSLKTSIIPYSHIYGTTLRSHTHTPQEKTFFLFFSRFFFYLDQIGHH